MYEGASNQSSDLKNYTAPRVKKFLDPPMMISTKAENHMLSAMKVYILKVP